MAYSKPKHLCTAKHCRRPRRPGRPLCQHHHAAQWREGCPHAYHLARLRNNAKRRGIAFALTLEQYRTAWAGHWPSGPKPKGLHLDRIDRAKGYEPGNVQVLPMPVHVLKTRMERAGVPLAVIMKRLAEWPPRAGGPVDGVPF